MKKIVVFFVLISLAFGHAVAQKNNDPGDLLLGKWMPSDERSVIEIYKGDKAKGEDPARYYGKVIWLKEPNDEAGNPRTDINNPEESLQSKPLLGLVMMTALEFTGNKKELEWENGEIYDPKNGSTYSFYVEMSPKKTNLLDARGYIGVSLFGRTDTWKRLVMKK